MNAATAVASAVSPAGQAVGEALTGEDQRLGGPGEWAERVLLLKQATEHVGGCSIAPGA